MTPYDLHSNRVTLRNLRRLAKGSVRATATTSELGCSIRFVQAVINAAKKDLPEYTRMMKRMREWRDQYKAFQRARSEYESWSRVYGHIAKMCFPKVYEVENQRRQRKLMKALEKTTAARTKYREARDRFLARIGGDQ